MRPGQADYLLLVATVMLLIVGLLAVYTASFAIAYNEFGDANFFVKRQVVFAIVGLVALFVCMQMDYQFLRRGPDRVPAVGVREAGDHHLHLRLALLAR